jgi:hypothetical protein
MTKAAAKQRLTLFEEHIYNPLMATIRERGDPLGYPRDVVLADALLMVHDELRRVAVEMGE